jgi:hypothetical protein
VAEQREELLMTGAPIRPFAEGRLDAVLPLDDAKLLDADGPILPGGKQDSAAVANREAAMVKRALAAGSVAVIICGDSHDLSAAVLQADQAAGYIRVAERGYLSAITSAEKTQLGFVNESGNVERRALLSLANFLAASCTAQMNEQ